jgi:hypothetical protein
VRGLYHWDSATIYLRDEWNATDLESQAILLHELVHHMQAFNGVPHDCRAELEPQAFRLTARWLEEQGVEDGYAFLNTDEFTVVAMAQCRDRHS